MAGLRPNPCLQAMSHVLDEHGIPYTIRHGGKHPQIVFSIDGRTKRRAFPATTSDRRSHLNARSQLKRLVREMKESL